MFKHLPGGEVKNRLKYLYEDMSGVEEMEDGRKAEEAIY